MTFTSVQLLTRSFRGTPPSAINSINSHYNNEESDVSGISHVVETYRSNKTIENKSPIFKKLNGYVC